MIAMPLFVAFVLAALCAVIVYMDLRYMRIPDWISLGAIVLFVVWVVIDYPSVPVMARLATATIMFAVCFGLFAARIMGGGDTKVLPALGLFIPLAGLPQVMILFALCLLASIGFIVGLRKIVDSETAGWAAFKTQKLPMGVAIGLTGLIAVGATLT